jgi:hypothetical protein
MDEVTPIVSKTEVLMIVALLVFVAGIAIVVVGGAEECLPINTTLATAMMITKVTTPIPRTERRQGARCPLSKLLLPCPAATSPEESAIAESSEEIVVTVGSAVSLK